MAQKFYNNIDLQQLELLNGTIENQANDAGAGIGVDGQLYFDTTDKLLKVYDETLADWKAVGGTSTGTVESVAATFAGTGFTATVTDPTTDASIAITANGASTDYINGEGNFIAFPADNNTTYALGTATGTGITTLTGSDAATTSLKIQGTTDEVEVTVTGTTANGVYTVGLPDDVTITDALTVGGTGEFTGQVTIPVLPLADTDSASKKYVDDNIAGGLIYQGGYNAATNTPDLDSGTSIAVSKGWTYTVTVEGLFFTEQVRVGDVLISEVDQAAGASALANWTTVQNNIDLASLTQVGIGNVIPSVAIDELGIAVAYTAGTAAVGLDIDGLAAAGSVATTTLVASELALPVYNSATPEVSNQKLTVAQIVTLATASTSYDEDVTPTAATSYTITHNLGTKKVIVQLYDKTTFDTFFADVVRTSDNVVTINFDLIPTNNFFVLVQK
jgi:hypothetical protein